MDRILSGKRILHENNVPSRPFIHASLRPRPRCSFVLTGGRLAGQESKPATNQQSTPVFRATTRLVTVDVVVKDKHGHPVPDLTAQDFQVFEQIPPKHGEQEEKIANFLAVSPGGDFGGEQTAGTQNAGGSLQQPGDDAADGAADDSVAGRVEHRRRFGNPSAAPDGARCWHRFRPTRRWRCLSWATI